MLMRWQKLQVLNNLSSDSCFSRSNLLTKTQFFAKGKMHISMMLYLLAQLSLATSILSAVN